MINLFYLKTSIWHLPKVKWKIMKNLMYFVQEAIPLHVKEIHILNMASYMSGFFTLLNTFLKDEVSRKVDCICQFFWSVLMWLIFRWPTIALKATWKIFTRMYQRNVCPKNTVVSYRVRQNCTKKRWESFWG